MGRDTLRLFRLVNPDVDPAVPADPTDERRTAPTTTTTKPSSFQRGWGMPVGSGPPPAAPTPTTAPLPVLPPSEVGPEAWQGDVVLRVGARRFNAHRFILVARSEVFAAMLKPAWREASEREVRSRSPERPDRTQEEAWVGQVLPLPLSCPCPCPALVLALVLLLALALTPGLSLGPCPCPNSPLTLALALIRVWPWPWP